MEKKLMIFGSENPNSYMILGILNTLHRNGVITEEQRQSIFSLGYYVEELSTLKDAKELKELLDNLKEKEYEI